MQKEPDYYAILGVDPAISVEELRQRHKVLVRELHPDTHGGDPALQERLTLVNVAFNELRDDLRRSAYDRRRREVPYRVSTLDYESQPEEEYIPRPVRRAVNIRYGTIGEQKRVHNRKAILGTLIAAVVSCVSVLTFLIISSGPFQSDTLDAANRPANTASTDSRTQAQQNRETAKLLQAESVFAQKYEDDLTAGEITLSKVNNEAYVLANDGNAARATLLRHHAQAFESELLSAGTDVRPAGVTYEQKFSDILSKRLVALEADNAELGKEEQGGSSGNMTDGKVASSTYESVQKARTMPGAQHSAAKL
jgi:curved DNA-binding protein CbpA